MDTMQVKIKVTDFKLSYFLSHYITLVKVIWFQNSRVIDCIDNIHLAEKVVGCRLLLLEFKKNQNRYF